MMDPLTTSPSERDRTNVPAARTGRWLAAHPVLGYVEHRDADLRSPVIATVMGNSADVLPPTGDDD